jgi:hypothetical protein
MTELIDEPAGLHVLMEFEQSGIPPAADRAVADLEEFGHLGGGEAVVEHQADHFPFLDRQFFHLAVKGGPFFQIDVRVVGGRLESRCRRLGIQAPGFNFTAYLKSSFLQQLEDRNELVLEDLHQDLKTLLEATKTTLRDHFRQRAAEGAVDLVETWKREDLYPYEPA